MVRVLMLALACALFSGCSSKVLVKKDSCKEVYDGALLECERATK